MSKLIPAVSYIRMSSDKQEDSPEQQRAEVVKLAKKHGCKIVREYFDPAISGNETRKRKQFVKMIDDATNKGDFEVILCWDQDRFGRFNSIEAGEWIAPLNRAGVRLITVAQGCVNWRNFAGRMIYAIQQEGKHQFLIDLSRNVMRGKLASVHQGFWLGPQPYGFDRLYFNVAGREMKRVAFGERFNAPGDWNAKLIPSEDQQALWIIRHIFETFVSKDCSMMSIAHDLNSRGISTPHGADWIPRGVNRILRNPAYAGDTFYGRLSLGKFHTVGSDGEIQIVESPSSGQKHGTPIIISETHDAIVSRKLFNQASEKLLRYSGRRSRVDNVHPFSGILRCGHCGGGLYGNSAARTGAYCCVAGQLKGKAICSYRSIAKETIEPFIFELLGQGLLKNKDRLFGIIKARAASRKSSDGDVKRVKTQLSAIQAKIERGTQRLLLVDDEGLADASETLNKWREERQTLLNQLDDLESRPGNLSPNAVATAAIE